MGPFWRRVNIALDNIQMTNHRYNPDANKGGNFRQMGNIDISDGIPMPTR